MFKRLQLTDYDTLKPFFLNHRYPLCQYSLSSLIFWNNDDFPVFWEISGGNLLIKELASGKPEARLYMPVSPSYAEPEPEYLTEISQANGKSDIYYVPGAYYSSHEEDLREYFYSSTYHGYSDYVYGREDMAELKGHRYSKKRNLTAQFHRNMADRAYEISPLSGAKTGDCLTVLEKWHGYDDSRENSILLRDERKAIIFALEHFDELEMRGIIIKIDGEPVGFAAGSRLSSDTFVLNFEKAAPHIKGLYQVIDQEMARSLPEQYLKINKESDLGKEGLKKAKESYFPSEIVESRILRPKSKPEPEI